MVPDLTLEVIYLNQPTDFKMEFELCGSSNVRFLSLPVKSHAEFLSVISKSVVRSRAIITVGSFNPLDKLYIPRIIAKATGYELKAVENEKFGIASENAVLLPEFSLPLVDENGNLGGCVLESNDQVIIMLTSDRELRHSIVTNLVCPYLKLFGSKETKRFKNISMAHSAARTVTKEAEQEQPGQPQTEPIQNASEEKEPDAEDNSINYSDSTNETNTDAFSDILKKYDIPFTPQAAVIPETPDVTVSPAVSDESETSNPSVIPLAQTIPESLDEPEISAESEAIENSEQPEMNLEPEKTDIPLTVDVPQESEPIAEDFSEPAEDTSQKSTEQSNGQLPQYSILEQPGANDVPAFDLSGFLIEDDEYEAKKPKKRKGVLKAIISIILVLAVLLASYFGYDLFFQPMQRDNVYEEVRNMYGQTWEKLPEDMLYKFGKLYQTNSDIYGWLSVPNTNINLPVVSSAEKASSYYRSHLFEGSVNRYGTPYTPSKVVKDNYHRNIVIYGKDTNDDVMFSELDKFLDIEQYKDVPTFTFDTLYLENKWKIFSVFKTKSQKKNDYLKTDFFDDTEFLEHIKLLEKVSAIDTNIDVTYTDQIVTLVSQADETDVILVARRVRDGESPMVDVTGSTETYDVQNKSDIPVVAQPMKPIDESSKEGDGSELVDSNMIDGASSRFEQQGTNSTITIKPTAPTISSVPDISSEKPSSSKPSSSSKTSSVTSSVSSNTPANNNLPILTVTNTFNKAKVKGNALDIIAQNIEAEMGSSYHIEALKAQAVAAYSWLLNNGSANGKYPSLPLKTPSKKCIEAANAVAGQVAVYNGKVATTYYYAISAGRSSYSQNIWSTAIPYLVSVDSSVDKSVKGFQTIRKYSADEIAQKAKKLLNVDLTKITDKNKWFTCRYDVNGLYCTKVKIGNVEKKGTYLRETFFNYDLRSSAYTISYNKNEDNFIFTVKGYGHGVGMSQTGANQYAKSGWNYEKILKHYFTGISLGTYYVD